MARILIIDDETNIRMMIRMALQHSGHEVMTAADGLEGLKLFGSGASWDLILLDQRMPGMEGLQVLTEMKKIDPRARVIMITAFGTIDLAIEAMKRGASDFLRKPFTADTLRGAVQTILRPIEVPSEDDQNETIFGLTTINGFRIESVPDAGEKKDGDIIHVFQAISPSGEKRACRVVLPAYLIELVKTVTDTDQVPGGDRFWHALCEEILANYLWQNARFPDSDELTADELTAGLRRWVETVISNAR
jgi:CheY-like chemotaxis protein